LVTGECPKGPAWADKAYSTDLAHRSTECSNAGACNRETGLCECYEGFTGSACQRSTFWLSIIIFILLIVPCISACVTALCPNDCSGHGACRTIRDVSLYDGFGFAYSNWDNSSVTMCDCDERYFSADCSLSESYACMHVAW
jgi:hypothetical protein